MTRKLPGKLLSAGFERQIRQGLVRAGSAGKRKRGAAGFEDVGPRTGPRLVKVTGAAGGGGFYTGNVWNRPTSTIDPSAALTEAALGTAGVACYYANLREVGASTHDLMDAENTKQKLFFGHYRGTAADGKPIYVGGDPWMEDCPEDPPP